MKDGASHRRNRPTGIPGRGSCKCKDLEAGRSLAYVKNLRKDDRGREMLEYTGKLARSLKGGVAQSGLCRYSLGTSSEANEAFQAKDNDGLGWAAGCRK